MQVRKQQLELDTSNRPATPLFSPACWELGFQAWAQSTCPELSAQGLHSSVLAWRIPGTGNLVGCRLWGRTESDTTEVTYPSPGDLPNPGIEPAAAAKSLQS